MTIISLKHGECKQPIVKRYSIWYALCCFLTCETYKMFILKKGMLISLQVEGR